jgi:hypothetical protein
MSCYPALKPGVRYLIDHSQSGSEVYVGTANHGVKLTGHNAILFLNKIDGQLELNEIIKEIGISSSQALDIISPLLSNNFLIMATTPTLKNFESVALGVSKARIIPELNTLSWRNTLSPINEILTRSEKEIVIIGKNRLAYALFELFISIGYLKCKISNNLQGLLQSELIGATPFKMSDIGQPISYLTGQINREYSLNLGSIKSDNLDISPGKLTINTTDIPIEEFANLLIDGSPHLQIGNLIAGKVEIGPIVIPGKTPCYNCILLWKSEAMKEMRKISIASQAYEPLELPAASATYLAGLIVSLVDNYFALEKSFLIGSSVVINLLKPLEYIERFWQPNPRCGCLELL